MLSMSNQRVRLKKILQKKIYTCKLFVEKRKKNRRKTAVAYAKKRTVNNPKSTFLGLICNAFSITIAPHFDGEGITRFSIFIYLFVYFFIYFIIAISLSQYSGLILPNPVKFWVGR